MAQPPNPRLRRPSNGLRLHEEVVNHLIEQPTRLRVVDGIDHPTTVPPFIGRTNNEKDNPLPDIDINMRPLLNLEAEPVRRQSDLNDRLIGPVIFAQSEVILADHINDLPDRRHDHLVVKQRRSAVASLAHRATSWGPPHIHRVCQIVIL